MKAKVLVNQSCQTLCNPMDHSPPGSSVHGILQAKTLEWVAIPLSRGSSQPRDQTWVACTAGRFFTIWATREALFTPCMQACQHAESLQSCLILCDPVDVAHQTSLFTSYMFFFPFILTSSFPFLCVKIKISNMQSGDYNEDRLRS